MENSGATAASTGVLTVCTEKTSKDGITLKDHLINREIMALARCTSVLMRPNTLLTLSGQANNLSRKDSFEHSEAGSEHISPGIVFRN